MATPSPIPGPQTKKSADTFLDPVNDARYSSENFDPDQEAADCLRNADSDQISTTIRAYKDKQDKVNGTIVRILERNSNLFIELSQCINSFEREFNEFPQKINEIQKIVSKVKDLKVPSIQDIPDVPTLPNAVIIGKPAWLVDAPLMYESLVQQHRIADSVDLVVRCLRFNGDHIPSIDAWVEKTSSILKSEIQSRLSSLSISSEAAAREFHQLHLLGFDDDGVTLFLKLAGKQIANSIASIQNTGHLLKYVELSSHTLCQEITQYLSTFTNLFSSKYFARFVNWAMETLRTKLPISRSDIFASNFELVKESLKIMEKEVSAIDQFGVSTLNIFQSMPDRLSQLLNEAVTQHIAEISEAVANDSWDIDLEKIGSIPASEYPISTSFEQLRSTMLVFSHELSCLYVPEIFYDCAKMISALISSYLSGCTSVLGKEDPSIGEFCAIYVQISCVEGRLLPEVLHEFQEITKHDFPDKAAVASNCETVGESVIKKLVDFFTDIWGSAAPLGDAEFLSMEEIDKGFQKSLDVMIQFLTNLRCPKDAMNKAVGFLVGPILKVVKETGTHVQSVEEMNSFDFHWEYFRRSLLQMIPDTVSTQLRSGIQAADEEIEPFLDANDKERMTLKTISAAVVNYMKKSLPQQ